MQIVTEYEAKHFSPLGHKECCTKYTAGTFLINTLPYHLSFQNYRSIRNRETIPKNIQEERAMKDLQNIFSREKLKYPTNYINIKKKISCSSFQKYAPSLKYIQTIIGSLSDLNNRKQKVASFPNFRLGCK